MKLAKSLLLGSAAALATVAGAQAADLPVQKAAPVAVEYVRVCSTYGAGFFVIPGTESCVKLTGRVRFEALGTERFNRAQDHFGFRARGRIGFDVRTPTPYGLLRTFVRFEATSNSGTPYGATQTLTQNSGRSSYVTGTNSNGTILNQAYVQFGGLTAGRTVSFFTNSSLPTGHFGTLRFDDAPDVTTLAYTYSFGNGLSVSLAVEDPWVRRAIGNASTLSTNLGTQSVLNVQNLQTGGFEYPDVVGNLKYEGTWGSAQLSGAIHQVTDIGRAGLGAVAPTVVPVFNDAGEQVGTVVTNPGSAEIGRRRAADDEIGFAVAFAGDIKLPMIAAGDAVWLAATYTEGALQYLSGGNAFAGGGSSLGFTSNNLGFQGNAGTGGLPITDGFIRTNARGRGNNIELTEGFAVAGGFRHFFIPSMLRTNIFGSFLHVDFGNGASRSVGRGNTVGNVNVSGTRVGFVDFNEYRIGGNLIWSPVSGLDIGVEVLYTNIQADNGRFVTQRPAAGAQAARFRVTDEEDIFEGRLRVQRDF